MASTPQARKAKGRRLQQWVRDFLLRMLGKGYTEDDIRSTSMGAGGEDVLFSSSVRDILPYSIECKNKERLNVWKSYAQAEENCGDWEPLLVIKRNHQKPLVVIDAEYFFELHGDNNE